MYASTIELTLHTNDAAMLFQGGTKARHFIPGFHYAQKRLNVLFRMGMAENPFAEGALIEVDVRLSEVEALTEEMIITANDALDTAKRQGIHYQLLTNKQPAIFKIEYASEYTAQLVKMMTQADMAFRLIRTAHSSGFLDSDTATLQIKNLRRKVRTVYDRIIHYANKITPGITRKDIEQKTAIGQTMIDKLGVPSSKILNKEITFKVKRIPELAI